MPIAAEIEKVIELPEGVQVSIDGQTVTVKGKNGELKRTFPHRQIKIAVEGSQVRLACALPRMKDKALLGTVHAHIANMAKGVSQGFEYELKLVYAHFPVKMSVKGDTFVIDNFIGEKSPRKARIMPDTKVSVKGDTVVVSGVDKELVGQSAANIELATRIKGYDTRVFQDGIYIVKKG